MKQDYIEIELGQVCTYSKGKKPKLLSKEKTHEAIFPYINIKAFEKGIFEEYTDGVKCNLCNDGDLLMVWDGARAGFTGKAKKGAIGSTLMKIEPKDGIDKDYLFYYLCSLYKKLNTNPRGVGIPHVEPRLLWNSKFVIYNSSLQRAIVAKIEKLFSDLDNGIANLKTAKQKLEIYRQAVLKKAFEGKLTKVDVKKVQELTIAAEDVIEYEKLSYENLPNGWKWVKSDSLFSFVTSGSRGWAKYYSDAGAIFIRVTNLNFDTLELDLQPSKIQYVSLPKNKTEGLRTKVCEGDFLFSITGYLGMFAIAPKLDNAYVNQHVSLCRPKDGFNKKYFGYWVISKSGGNKHFNSKTKGAVKAGLNLDDLRTIPIPLPPSIEEQNQIVHEIESRLSVAENLEFVIRNSLIKSEALRQSILKMAFEGRLLSQSEIQSCKQEPDYEPAQKLLEKIKNKKPC
jgi:type I restriction enzyme S subunit